MAQPRFEPQSNIDDPNPIGMCMRWMLYRNSSSSAFVRDADEVWLLALCIDAALCFISDRYLENFKLPVPSSALCTPSVWHRCESSIHG